MIAFQTAYLKTHYPINFCSVNDIDMNNTDKISIFQQELTRLKIKLSPKCKLFGTNFLSNDSILYALGAIKNVGIESMIYMMKEK